MCVKLIKIYNIRCIIYNILYTNILYMNILYMIIYDYIIGLYNIYDIVYTW